MKIGSHVADTQKMMVINEFPFSYPYSFSVAFIRDNLICGYCLDPVEPQQEGLIHPSLVSGAML